MTMADVIDFTLSLLFGLLVSFLLAKLFSILFSFSSSGDQTLTNPNKLQPHVIQSLTRRKSAQKDKTSQAEFSKKPLIDYETKVSSDIDDDWEGVETTELDDAFCAATEFVAAVAADRSVKKVSSSVQLKLYGLFKVATEGACSAPQPSAIKITARAKWNAWHKLGAMSQEEAMQKYLDIITELYPNWADGSTHKKKCGDNNETSSKDTTPMGPDISSLMHDEESVNDFKLDAIDDYAIEGGADNLLKHTAGDVSGDTKDGEDQTPLRQAVDDDNIGVNLKDTDGQTHLHHAAVCERDETGALPVKNNAATGVQDDDDDEKYPSDLSHSDWHSIQP